MAFRCSNPLLVMGVEMTASAKNDTPRTLLQIVRNAVREFFAPCGWVRINRLERELTAARAEAEALRKDAVSLWKLLDDIDTASDRFKTNYEGLAKYVYFTQRKRFEIMTGEQFDAARGAEGK